MDGHDVVKVLLVIGFFVYQIYSRYKKYQQAQKARATKSAVESAKSDTGDAAAEKDTPAEALTQVSPIEADASRDQAKLRELIKQLTSLRATAVKLAQGARVERHTRIFATTLDEHVVKPAETAIAKLKDPRVPVDETDFVLSGRLSRILKQIEVFVRQRRDPDLRGQLGDADTLALNCYGPLIEFAVAHDLQLTSTQPATQLGGYNLATWTRLLPTGIAPIFLPAKFLTDLFWWPAVAHEIGHDFFAATKDVEQGMRRQLGLPDERSGTRVWPFGGRTLVVEERLWNLLGGWFEEFFCDAIGSLMLGAAYGQSMVRLFAAPRKAKDLLLVERGDRTHYGIHPPRHLRVVACAHLLKRMGDVDESEALLKKWRQAHRALPNELTFPRDIGSATAPLEPFVGGVTSLIDRLYDGQFTVLAGYRLRDIPGVDYGPSLHAQTRNVAATLAAGRVPRERIARAVIAGAVAAACAEPARASEFLAQARRAIVAEGTFEHAPDAYSGSGATSATTNAQYGLRDAFILHTILAPPPSMRCRRKTLSRFNDPLF